MKRRNTRKMPPMDPLPIEPLLPPLRDALDTRGCAVLEAPPGAGKTTRVPLALLDADWLGGRKLVMLEPRRLAARAAASYMAQQLGETAGETVGYRVRMDNRVGPHTRIEVVTEGVLTRMLQSDPSLSGYGAVIFDEFHERSLHADLALALCVEARQALRPDLRLLVMSATLAGDAVARLLDGAPRLRSGGRSFPVVTKHCPPPPGKRLEAAVAQVTGTALAEETGSLLVFLPGAREIRRVAELLDRQLPGDVELVPLYGDLAQAQQDAAIRKPPPGRRKVVLATAIAESSLTIEGVRVVVDSGWSRVPRFDPVSGMTRLVTVRVSRASADQRRGRAGRLEPGVCYRLWSEGERLEAHSAPEITQADLASLVLELAQWGAQDASQLAWLNPPPAAALSQARELLQQLGALDQSGRITAHGRRLVALPLHPRLAHMVVRGAARGAGWLACLIAALVSERDILSGPNVSADAGLRLRLLADESARADDAARVRRVRAIARDIAGQAGVARTDTGSSHDAGLLLALAYPDRIAQRRPGSGARFLLSNGRGAFLPDSDPLGHAAWLAVAELDGEAREARIFLAAELDEAELRQEFAGQIQSRDVLAWDEDRQAVDAAIETRLGALLLERRASDRPDVARVAALLADAIRRKGLGVLPWTPASRNWQARVMFLHREAGNDWPAVDDAALAATLDAWLLPYLHGKSRVSHLADLPLQQALAALLDYRQQRLLDELAPTHVTVPTGSRIAIDYTSGEVPVLAVRLQELFGLAETPAIMGGRVPLLLHLLSPARRPVQVTRDLAGFWRSSYRDVRKDLRGRYPKHYWPDDPLQAEPVRGVRRKRG
ncbi:MAG TPA: ATP-dependent helicase HrpB [Gammaproteobacteria bacterium]|nr:ATP-dependent helicase HrpB [Gammaproteobacteria bacterium]